MKSGIVSNKKYSHEEFLVKGDYLKTFHSRNSFNGLYIFIVSGDGSCTDYSFTTFLERLPRPPQIRQWQQAIITFNLHKALYMAIAFPGPLFQNEGRCSAFDMEIISHSHANKSHFHKKGCAPTLILKVRVFGTRKWPIILRFGGFSSTGTNPTLPWC